MPGAFKLDHLQPIKPLLFPNFPSFPPSYWEANSFYPIGLIIRKGHSSNFKIGWDRGDQVPGAFKLDHLQPLEPILSQKIFNFSTFILGGQFLLPQRANNGKREFIQLQNLMRQRGYQCLGHSNLTICSPLSPFCPKIFSTFSLSYWEPILFTPEVQ